jgi:hypothetical protein
MTQTINVVERKDFDEFLTIMNSYILANNEKLIILEEKIDALKFKNMKLEERLHEILVGRL